jgi:hypothetical protein
MSLENQAFNDILKRTIPLILPNTILDCPLKETKEYEKLVSILPQKEHFLWDRVVLNYSAKLVNPDMLFFGMSMDRLMINLDNLYDNTIEFLFFYYFDVDISKWKLEMDENDEYYYESGDQKINQYTVQKLVCTVLAEDYNKLHFFIDGFLLGVSKNN